MVGIKTTVVSTLATLSAILATSNAQTFQRLGACPTLGKEQASNLGYRDGTVMVSLR